MDDTEDDARYPPNPYPQNNRRPFSSSHYSNLYDRDYFQDYANEDEVDLAMNHPVEEAEQEEEEEEEQEEQEEQEEEESSDSRSKRRRLDRYARGFELVPRLSASPSLNPLQCRISSADWSENSTFALLDVWGDRYMQNGRKSLRSDEWIEVAKKVSQVSKTPRSEIQCRNRLDTLKKKYKKEKSKCSEYSRLSSKWIYFQKMDELMLSPCLPPRLSCGIDAGEYVFASSVFCSNQSSGMHEMRDSPSDTETEGEGEEVDDESDELPPKREKFGGNSESSFKLLDVSIQKFGAVYEKIESSKRQQMAELERMRKEFQRELELQKSQILDRAQAEIARLRQENGEDDEEGTDEDDNGDDDDDDDDIDVSVENING